MSSSYYEGIRDFIGFMHKQDNTTVMYKSGMKLVELCKMTRSMGNIEEDVIKEMQERAN